MDKHPWDYPGRVDCSKELEDWINSRHRNWSRSGNPDALCNPFGIKDWKDSFAVFHDHPQNEPFPQEGMFLFTFCDYCEGQRTQYCWTGFMLVVSHNATIPTVNFPKILIWTKRPGFCDTMHMLAKNNIDHFSAKSTVIFTCDVFGVGCMQGNNPYPKNPMTPREYIRRSMQNSYTGQVGHDINLEALTSISKDTHQQKASKPPKLHNPRKQYGCFSN